MSNHKSRLAKLESGSAPDKTPYVCMYYTNPEAGGMPPRNGYDVTPLGVQFLSPGQREAAIQHFESRAALDAFAARPDVDLTLVAVTYADYQEGRG